MPGFPFCLNKKDTGMRRSRWASKSDPGSVYQVIDAMPGIWSVFFFFFYSLWNCFIFFDHFPLFLRSPPPVLLVGYFVEHAQLEGEDLVYIPTVEREERGRFLLRCSFVSLFPFQRKTDLSQFFRGLINKKITPTSRVVHCFMEIKNHCKIQ